MKEITAIKNNLGNTNSSENFENDRKIRAEIRAILNGEDSIQAVFEHLCNLFPTGTRVELVRTEDLQIPIGTRGTVVTIDPLGSILVAWDDGNKLSIVYGVDECRTVSD